MIVEIALAVVILGQAVWIAYLLKQVSIARQGQLDAMKWAAKREILRKFHEDEGN